ncbi:MAG: Sensor histidine kinase RcsC [Anaerolineae bacterium]|nr:Sensor histidine kinase RcsC [Anaerolineae bacterium]
MSTILIVDDEPMARDIIEGFLAREGYILAFAENGPETFAYLDANPVDIILLDVMLPGMDGYTICRRIKTDVRRQHIPVILVTALGSNEDLEQGFEARADDFLTKPVSDVELKARVRSLLRIKHQYDELQRALKLREDLAHMIVHDMRSPITAIIGYSNLLQTKGSLSAEDTEDVNKIYSHARRLNSFLNDMLMVAKMEDAGEMILYRTDQDVNQLINEVVTEQQIIARLKRCELVVQLPADGPRLAVDANLFRRVLDNLISNAIKFSSPQGKIVVRLETLPVQPEPEAAAKICLQVVDEGPGIAPENRERIFEKYEVVSLKKEGDSQIGLGLVFCRMVVEAHGGRIAVTENQPTGSIFTIEL